MMTTGATARRLSQDMTAEEYHSYPAVSNSRLSDFIQDPRLYHYKWMSGKYKPISKPHFEIGSCVHELVLLDTYSATVIPDEVLGKNGSKSTKAYKEWAEARTGPLITKSEDEKIHAIADAILTDPVAAPLLQGEEYEPELPMEADILGLKCKCRFDAIHLFNYARAVIVDIKTTSKLTNRESFAKSVANFGYYRQEALYRRIAEKNGLTVADFVFIAACTEPPYTVDCYRLDSAFVQLGMDENLSALSELSERMESGFWGSRNGGAVRELEAPKWLIRKGGQ